MLAFVMAVGLLIVNSFNQIWGEVLKEAMFAANFYSEIICSKKTSGKMTRNLAGKRKCDVCSVSAD